MAIDSRSRSSKGLSVFFGTTKGLNINRVINCKLAVSLTDVAQQMNLRHGDATIFDLRRPLSMPKPAEDSARTKL